MSHDATDAQRPQNTSFFVTIFLSYWLVGLAVATMSQYMFIEETVKRAFASQTAPMVAQWLYSRQSAQRFSVPQGRPDLPPEGTPRAPITVALVTDDDLERYKTTYPLAYGFHAERLDSIASHQPKAIFIDIAFLDQRTDASLPELIEVLCDIRQRRNIPLFLAALDYAGQSLRPEMEAAAARGCFQKVTVPRRLDRYDRHNWEYALQWQDSTSGKTFDSPALAIFKALHPDDRSYASQPSPPDLGLLWGLSPHSYNAMRMKRPDGTPLCRESWQFLREIPVLSSLIFDHLLGPDDYTRRHDLPYCPYHATVPLHFLADKGEVVEQLMHDRIVMYAVDLQSVGDYSFSPLHGATPGVLVHAMALDNLLAFDGAYPRAQEFAWNQPLSAGSLFSIGMITLVALLATTFHYLRGPGAPLVRRLVQRVPEQLRHPGQMIHLRFRRSDAILGLTTAAPPAASPLARRWRKLRGDLKERSKKFALMPLALAAYSILLVVVGQLGIHVFKLGMLSWIEYAMIPMILETFHLCDGLAAYLHKLYLAGIDDDGVPPDGEDTDSSLHS